MKKVTIVFDFESQSLDVSVNDAHECVTPATTVEEMYAKEVFAIRPVNESRYVILHYADIVWVEASNNNSVFHMADLWQAGGNSDTAPTVFPENACGGVKRRNHIIPAR